jgi:hypothetical protein
MAPFIISKRVRPLLTLIGLAVMAPGLFAGQTSEAVHHVVTKEPSLTRFEQEAAARLKTPTIREVTKKLAAPEMEGRGTAQPGGDRAARYVADRFAKIGLKPKGDAETYFQAINFRVQTALGESSFNAGDARFTFKDEFVVDVPLPDEPTEVSASLVFVGYGVVSPALKHDDLSSVSLKGKIAVVLEGKPTGVDAATWERARDFPGTIERLSSRGAVGLVFLYEPTSYLWQRPFPLQAIYRTRRRVQRQRGPRVKMPPSVLINPSAAEKLFAGSGISYLEAKQKAEAGGFVSRDLGKQALISVRVKVEEGISRNVIGVVEGSDNILRNESVVYSAHYDAFGIDPDGTIFPGAADNALGVGKLIATAEVYAKMKPKPRRSILFIAFTGEEYGLLGAEHWLLRATWPIDMIAANLNYDGIGSEVWGKLAKITDTGFGHSDLGGLIAEVATASNIAIVPDEPGYSSMYRSDSYEFLKRGIPAILLRGGPQGDQSERLRTWYTKDYHMSTDSVRPDWEWDGARALSVLGLVTGMRIANRDVMPAWIKSSPYNRPRGTQLPPPPR